MRLNIYIVAVDSYVSMSLLLLSQPFFVSAVFIVW